MSTAYAPAETPGFRYLDLGSAELRGAVIRRARRLDPGRAYRALVRPLLRKRVLGAVAVEVKVVAVGDLDIRGHLPGLH